LSQTAKGNKMTQMNLFKQRAREINEAEQLESDQEAQMELDSLTKQQHQLIERDNIEILDAGPLGVKWRGANIPNDDSMYENDYTPQFGFSCASCGASAVNQEPVNHKEFCERKNENE
jgi:hypothetical protein